MNESATGHIEMNTPSKDIAPTMDVAKVKVEGESIQELEEIELSETIGDSKEVQENAYYGEYDENPDMAGLFAKARTQVQHKMLNKIVVTNMKNQLQPVVNDEIQDFLKKKLSNRNVNKHLQEYLKSKFSTGLPTIPGS